jgi:ABC-type nitrate/sulfonate/bicarbonate transport system substrate-binding protein
MRAVEFTVELGPEPLLAIPEAVAAQLPKTGQARIIVLTADNPDDTAWRLTAYEQFMREDPPEDAVYDNYR